MVFLFLAAAAFVAVDVLYLSRCSFDGSDRVIDLTETLGGVDD